MSLRTPPAERTVGEQCQALRDTIRRDAAQDRGIVPDTELDLNGGDLRDAPRFFDLTDRDVAQADAGDQAIAFHRGKGPHTRRQRRARIWHMPLIEGDAIDAQRSTAPFTRRPQVLRPSVRLPTAFRPRHTALGGDGDPRSITRPG